MSEKDHTCLGEPLNPPVVPEFKAIHIMLPGDENFYFSTGLLTDPATGVQLEVEKVFEDLI